VGLSHPTLKRQANPKIMNVDYESMNVEQYHRETTQYVMDTITDSAGEFVDGRVKNVIDDFVRAETEIACMTIKPHPSTPETVPTEPMYVTVYQAGGDYDCVVRFDEYDVEVEVYAADIEEVEEYLIDIKTELGGRVEIDSVDWFTNL